jgi:hypothetical protein
MANCKKRTCPQTYYAGTGGEESARRERSDRGREGKWRRVIEWGKGRGSRGGGALMRPSPCRFLGEPGGETEEVASRSKNEEDLTIRGKTALLLARLSQSGEREKIGKRKVWGSGFGCRKSGRSN